MNETTALWIAVSLLGIAIIYLAIRLYSLHREFLDVKYLIVEKKPDGGTVLKNSKGQIILEL